MAKYDISHALALLRPGEEFVLYGYSYSGLEWRASTTKPTETELNMKILSKVMEFLKDKRSKMVLYTYDSYLLDIHSDDFNSLQNLKILIEGNGFPTKVEIGDRYSEMESIDIETMDRI